MSLILTQRALGGRLSFSGAPFPNKAVALKNMKNSIFYIFPYLYFDILLLQSFGAFQAIVHLMHLRRPRRLFIASPPMCGYHVVSMVRYFGASCPISISHRGGMWFRQPLSSESSRVLKSISRLHNLASCSSWAPQACNHDQMDVESMAEDA